MADRAPLEDDAGYDTLVIPRRGLKALSGIDGLTGGPLSPLARLQSPAGAADAGALIAAWEALDDTWRWAVPALLGPQRTIALVLGDGNTNLIGQYLFPDAEAYGPGFHVDMGREAVSLTGPLSLGMLRVGFYSHLALEEVEELSPFRTELAADHFWPLMACLDTYRAAALERRLHRAGGAPPGVGFAEIEKAWVDGTSSVNPGWAVSLFSLLVPDRVPRDLPERLPRLLPEMTRQGHLKEAVSPGAGGVLYSFSESLSSLLWGLTSVLNFGLITQRLAQPRSAEVTILGGWRTPGGVWMADLSDMDSGLVSLALTGPALADDIIDAILGNDTLAPPWEEFAMETPYERDVLVSRLRETVAAAPERALASHGFCTHCGRQLLEGVRFCRECGAEVEIPEAAVAAAMRPVCPGCGLQLRPGARFCRMCGKPQQGQLTGER